MTKISYKEAIVAAQREALKTFDNSIIFGEDVGEPGGPFKTVEGLHQEFGQRRVFDTPISENAFVGAALGMAITGLRPIVELMFADFMGVCYDQIVNGIAKHRFMCGGKVEVPLVIRAMGGGGVRFGAQHSQTCENWLYQIPGLKVYCPATPADAYELLISAVHDIDPVIVLEHKGLFTITGEVEFSGPKPATELGPKTVRQGSDVTLVASLAMVGKALEAAELLQSDHGISAEVINLRVLRPLRMKTIVQSVKKTSRLVVVEENHPAGGWSADVIANTVNQAFDYLDHEPIRVTLPDWPMPYSPELEDAAIPSPSKIVNAVLETSLTMSG